MTEHTGPDPAEPLVFRDVQGWWAIMMLVIGRETGMLDAIMRQPATAAELAQRADVDQINAAAWLAAMTSHGYVTHANGTFTMVDAEAAALRGDVFPLDVMAMLDFSNRAPRLLSKVADAVCSGTGIPPATFHEALGDAATRVNAPLYKAVLLDDWLKGAGVAEDLRRGVHVAEIACGNGAALIELGTRCPASTFVGYDLDAASVNTASVAAADRGTRNVRFCAADGGALNGPFDLVMILDAFHHIGRPEALLKKISQSLRPSGKLVIAEATASGQVDTDAASPFARIVLSANLYYCLQESLHDNGIGLGAVAGAARITALLHHNGFDNVTEYVTSAGYSVYTASAGAA